ncbi:MAG: recombinase RecA [Anaerolineales bacterium]
MMADDPRKAALDKTLKDITKRFGEGAIMKLGEAQSLEVDAIPTGTLSLDLALGVGGIPRGRVTEIYGPEASGKTTICQHIVAEAQKRGGTAAFIDMEHALDPQYAARTGVDIDNLLISQPDTGEQALEIAESLIRSGAVDIIVIDSVAALVPRAEIEGDMGDAHMGLMARLMSQALRKLSGAIKQTNTSLIFTNQLREKIGVVFGNPETTPGGRALKFYSSVRLDCRRIQSIKSGSEIIGSRVRVRVVKNKVAPPFRTAEFDIMHDEGISRVGDLLDLGVDMEVVDKRGSYYYYGDDMRLAQGRENAKDFLRENPDIANQIEEDIRGLAFEDQQEKKPKGEVEYDEDEHEEDEYEEEEEA